MKRWQGRGGQGLCLVSWPSAFWPEEHCTISHTAAKYKQDINILSPLQSILQCYPLFCGWDMPEAHNRVTQLRCCLVQGNFLTPGPLQGTSASDCSILCQSGHRDLWQHFMLRLNLHTLLTLGAERLYVNRPEPNPQCQQKCRNLSQQKTRSRRCSLPGLSGLSSMCVLGRDVSCTCDALVSRSATSGLLCCLATSRGVWPAWEKKGNSISLKTQATGNMEFL